MGNINQTPFDSVNVSIDNIEMNVLLDYVVSRGIYDATYIAHKHPVHELYYIAEGWMLFECDGKAFNLSKGDIFIIKAYSPHRVVECDKDTARFHLRFQLTSNSESALNIFDSKYIVPSAEHRSEIAELIERIRKSDVENISKYELFRLRTYLGVLFSYILEYMDETEAAGSCFHGNMEQYNRIITFALIDNFFSDHYNTCRSIDELSQLLKYSKIQTQRIILEYYGITFSQKLRDIRIQYAKKFLTETDLTIDEIAEKCGYSTRQGFDAAFVKSTSMTPNKYRQSQTDKGSDFR